MTTAGRVMVVEDEAVVAMDIESTLEDLGYDVVAVTGSAEEAIEKAGETDPDLAMVDIRLPGKMDGIDAARILRDEFGVSIVYLTAYSDEELVRRAKRTEPGAYLLKPFDERGLYCAVETTLYKHQSGRTARDEPRSADDWRAAFDRLEAEIETDRENAMRVPADRFFALTLKNVVDSLSGLKRVVDALSGRAGNPDACHLIQCPRRRALERAIGLSIDVLKSTKKSFKSKELAELRRTLETVLQRNAPRAD